MAPEVTHFFDEATGTLTYVVAEPGGDACAIVDPVLDFDPKSGRTGTKSADAVADFVRGRGLTVAWLLETHVHADHVSAAPYLQGKLGGRTGIGAHIRDVQAIFREIFNAEPEFRADGSQFDRLFADGDRFAIGGMTAHVLHTPGHTPADVTYVIGDAAFVGDSIFMPDFGTARCDFPGGDARQLYRSIGKILALPPDTRLFVGHDYRPNGRALRFETTVAEQRESNCHIGHDTGEDDFVAMRTERDSTLAMPNLLLPAVQINMRGGRMPPPESNGVSYLKIPLDRL